MEKKNESAALKRTMQTAKPASIGKERRIPRRSIVSAANEAITTTRAKESQSGIEKSGCAVRFSRNTSPSVAWRVMTHKPKQNTAAITARAMEMNTRLRVAGLCKGYK